MKVALRLACLLSTALPGLAAETIDLTRVTPVPAGQPVPIQDFFRPRTLHHPTLNAAGTHIAAIITLGEDQQQLLVHNIRTQKSESVTAMGDKDIVDVTWLNDDRLVFSLTTEKLYHVGLFAAKVGEIKRAYPLLQYYGSTLVAVPPLDPLHPLVWNRWDFELGRDVGAAAVEAGLRAGGYIDLLSAANTTNPTAFDEVRNMNEKHIARRFPVPPNFTYEYLADVDGNLEFAHTSHGLYHLKGKVWEKCPVDLDAIDIIGPGNEPGQLVVLAPRVAGKPRALQLMDGVTGQLGDVLLQDKAYDYHGWLYRDTDTRGIMGAVVERNGPKVVWFNQDYAAIQKALDGFFPGLIVRILGSNEKRNLLLVGNYSDRQPTIYSWVDLKEGKVGVIKNSAPWIDPERMQPMNVMKFKTRDGHPLDAYVTLPQGASKANPPPLVVLCHGGPWARDNWAYNGEVQFLASRGYAVLQPNYRGSLGYDWQFPDEDRFDFLKMHQDVTDAVHTLTATGTVDSQRIAIMGGSFGGYLAMSGVVHEPTLYRCAVTIAGVFDWEQQLAAQKREQFNDSRYAVMTRRLGDPAKMAEKFAAISPGRHVDRVRVPVFVAGGKSDWIVEIEQSKRLIADLQKNKVPHESYFVGAEGHGMAHLANQVELYGRIEAFLAKNLQPK